MKKSELLNWLQAEQQQWQALLDQIGPTRLDQPGVAANWSVKDIIAHLNGWQTGLIGRLQAAQRGEPDPLPPWPAQLQSDDEINAWIYQTNQQRPAGEILDETLQQFQQLLAVIELLPGDVRIDPVLHLLWLNDKSFAAGEFFDHFHDDHEPDIRAWLARGEKT